MGFLLKNFRREEFFEFSNQPPSPRLVAVLQEASKKPLENLTWRMVLVTPWKYWVFDMEIFQVTAYLKMNKKIKRVKARHEAASIIAEIAFRGVMAEVNILNKYLRAIFLSFFDINFTTSANKGKNQDKFLNTLALDVQIQEGKYHFIRSAHRLNFPE